MNTLRQPLPRRVACLLMILLLLFQSARAVAPGPAWWTQHGVLDPDGARDDFAAANIGQLKYLATQADAALDEAEAASPVPLSSAQAQAKSAIDAMTAEWSALPLPEVPRDDFLALNAGQLKHVAALFYDRLGLPPPWAGAAPLGDDFRLVNVGQLKQAFSFELRLARGGPPVQIPASWWDTAHTAWAALDSTQRAAGSTVEDFNGNGLSNLEEYLMHPARLLFDPDDKDGDRIPDVAEAASGGILSPLVFADAVEDHDNDGVMNYEEVLLGLNLNGPVTTGRADSLTDAEVLAWGLLAGVPLAPGTDAVRACWEAIDEAWIEQQGGMEFYGHWLDRTPASGVPAGWTAFQAEFWGPTSPDAASIQYPPTPIDLDGDDIPDMDRDGDGLPDLWEYRHELDLRGAEDAWDDPDGDTLVNLMEFANGTNPRLADTDGDGFSDAEEGQHGGDPRQGGSVPPVFVQIIGESAHTHYPGQTTPALAVRATQAGIARMGVEITFTLTAGNGVLSPATQAGGGSAASLTLSTGADGIAAVTYTAAAQAEQAQVQAAAAGAAGTHVFTVHVIPMPPIFAGWGAGGGTTGSATAPPSAPAATAAVAAASDGMLIRVRRKYESDESFPGRDFKNSPSEFLGPNGMDPASSGGLNIPFDNPNLAHHTELTLQWASAGPARSRTYLVLVFKGRDAYARWAIIDGVRVGVPDMVGSVTFAVDQHGMLAVTTSGNLSGYMEKVAGEASVAFTHEPPTSEDERFVISLLPFDIEKASLSDGQFIVNVPDVSSGAVGTLDLIFKKQGGGEIIAKTIQNQAPGKVTIALDEILTGAANTPAKPFDNQDAAKCDKIYARWRVGTIDVKTGDRSFDDVQINGQTKKVAAVEVLAKRKISNYFSPEWSGTWSGTVRSKGTYRAGEWPASLTNIDVAGKLLDALDPANEGLAMDGTTVIRDRYRPAQDGHPQVTALNGAATIQNEADTQGYTAGYICKPDVDQDNASSPRVTLLRAPSVAVKYRSGGGTDADRLTYDDMVYIPDIPDVHLRTVDDTGGLHGNRDQIDVWRGQGDETLANIVRSYFKPASTCLKVIPVAAP
jgi:hypothetical protein